jgi:hypothetical protein
MAFVFFSLTGVADADEVTERGEEGVEEVEEDDDSDGDDFNVQLDAPDTEAYEVAQQSRAAEASARKAERAEGGGGEEEEEEDDDFNVFLDDPSQSVMGGPDVYQPQSNARQYIRCTVLSPAHLGIAVILSVRSLRCSGLPW